MNERIKKLKAEIAEREDELKTLEGKVQVTNKDVEALTKKLIK